MSHLKSLENRHAELDKQITEATSCLGFDEAKVTDMKRRKLRLKDQIAAERARLNGQMRRRA